MIRNMFSNNTLRYKHVAVRLFQAAALALAIAMVMPTPARAADDRAVKSRVAPIYPDIAKRMRVSGVVTVEATVEPSGKVSEAKRIAGNQLLGPAAENAVRQWQFAPGPGVSKVNVSVNFAMAQ
jgi:TonB family protein